MTPQPPTRFQLESLPPRVNPHIPVWKGDKLFVLAQIVTALISLAIIGQMMGSFHDFLLYARASKGDRDLVRNVLLALSLIALFFYIPIMFVLLAGSWKGKKWAYITTTCLLGLSVLVQLYRIIAGSTSSYPDLEMYFVIAVILAMSKLAFCGMRLSGNIGTPLH